MAQSYQYARANGAARMRDRVDVVVHQHANV